MKNYYQILKLDSSATKEEIREAYRILSHFYHPDKHKEEARKKKAAEKFIEIKEAYDVLSDDKKKEDYDLKFNQHSAHDNKEIDNLKQKIKEKEIEIENLKQKETEKRKQKKKQLLL